MKDLLKTILSKRLILVLVTTCLSSLFNSMFTTLITRFVSKSLDQLPSYVLTLALFVLSWMVVRFVTGVLQDGLLERVTGLLYSMYFNKLYSVKLGVLKSNNTGYISGLLEGLVQNTTETVGQFVALLVDLCYIMYFAILLGLKCVLLFPLILLLGIGCGVIRVLLSKLITGDTAVNWAKAMGYRSKMFIDGCSNICTVKRLQALKFFDSEIRETSRISYIERQRFYIRAKIASVVQTTMSFSLAPIGVLVICYCNPELLNDSVYIAMFTTVCTQLPHNAKALANLVRSFTRVQASITSLDAIVNQDTIDKRNSCTDFNEVRIHDLTYSYCTDDNKSVTIQVPDFRLCRDSFVCITGESGQGKTTLLNLISGEIETDKVMIDNNISSCRLDCVYIGQDTEIFDMSLRDNLTLGKDIPDSILYEYLDKVGLTDWISKQSSGLDVLLGERGVFVSTGQRQRLNLVRGLLVTDKELYILDEPTSNVDEVTEQRIISLIQEVLKDKTVIIVTHREAIKSLCNDFYEFKENILYHTEVYYE